MGFPARLTAFLFFFGLSSPVGQKRHLDVVGKNCRETRFVSHVLDIFETPVTVTPKREFQKLSILPRFPKTTERLLLGR